MILPSARDLSDLFRKHYGDPKDHGWRVRMWNRFNYFSGDDWYQAVVDKLVTDNCMWIDVGGGKSVFPHNPILARELADRCGRLVGVDPSDNLDQNDIVHERARETIENFTSEDTFDLATLRMVAEHIERPERVVASLARLIQPGGHVVIHTPNRWSPASIAAAIVPNQWHPYLMRRIRGSNEEDVFPTQYKMNTRKRLKNLFEQGGFSECAFAYVDNCAIFQRFQATCFLELSVWKILNNLDVRYPENDLLGVYKKT